MELLGDEWDEDADGMAASEKVAGEEVVGVRARLDRAHKQGGGGLLRIPNCFVGSVIVQAFQCSRTMFSWFSRSQEILPTSGPSNKPSSLLSSAILCRISRGDVVEYVDSLV